MIRIMAAAGSALRLLVELVIVVLTGEEQQPEQRAGRHSRRGTVPRDWSPLPADVRRQLAPTFYGAQPA
jgi:hypothetical protein